MPRRRLPLIPVLLLCALALPAAARGGYKPGDSPKSCQSPLFHDVVGTAGDDVLTAGSQPERLYGLLGSDRLTGGAVRAACLFGGRDPDVLRLGAAGGIALGEDGPDVIYGSDKDDAVSGGTGPDYLSGALGRDVLRGDDGRDYYDAGPGDDAVFARDDRAEIVACGSGVDTVAADSDDALIGCENVRRSGDEGLALRKAHPKLGGARTTFRLRFRAPASGRHGLYVAIGNRCDKSPPAIVTQIPAPGERVRRGQQVRVGLRAPKGGWCEGERDIVMGQVPPCRQWKCLTGLPPHPLFRVRVKVRPR